MGPPYPNITLWLTRLFTSTLALRNGPTHRIPHRPLSSFFFPFHTVHNLDQPQPSIVIPVVPEVTASKLTSTVIIAPLLALYKASSHLSKLLRGKNTENGELTRPNGLEI